MGFGRLRKGCYCCNRGMKKEDRVGGIRCDNGAVEEEEESVSDSKPNE